MSEIICPHCGSPNPIDADSCSNCHKSLYEEPSEPFQAPAGNGLDWLQDYRSFGTNGSFISDEDSQPGAEPEPEPPAESESKPVFVTDTGEVPSSETEIHSNTGDESDIPDWLARVRARSREDALASGQEPPAPPTEPKFNVGEPIKTDWLRDLTGTEEKPAAGETNAYPDWLKRISARSQEAKKAREAGETTSKPPFDLSGEQDGPQTSGISEEEETVSPFIQPDAEPTPLGESQSEPEAETDLFNLYSQELESLSIQPPITPEAVETESSESPPDTLPPEPETPAAEELPAFITEGLPEEPAPEEVEPLEEVKPIPDIDWLDESYIEKPEPEAPGAEEVGGIDWTSEEIGKPVVQPWDALANLERLQAENEEPVQPSVDPLAGLSGVAEESAASVEENEDILADLDWLKAQHEEQIQSFDETQTTPEWLTDTGEDSSSDALANLEKLLAERQSPVDGDTDVLADQDWLKTQGQEPVQPIEETPANLDWLSTDQEKTREPSFEAEPEQPAQLGEIPEWLFMQEESEESPKAPSIPKEPLEEFSIYDEESLPEWLKEETPADTEKVSPVAAQPQEKSEMPDWLKGLPTAEPGGPAKAAFALEEHIEESGPLAGFQGILPGEETITHYTKPPTYTGRLQVTEKQRIYATMFDTIISSEKKVGETIEKKTAASSQMIRLFVGILMIGVVIIALFFDAHIAAPPVLYPGENAAFFDAIQSITGTTASSRILVGLDYEPSLSGEVGTAAAYVLQDLMAGNSSLAFVSLNPTGPALAEDLVSRANQAIAEYPAKEKVVNLGYLPGGASALASLASNPITAAPINTDGAAAWDSGPLQGIRSISDFDAVLLLTDNSESARTWIEQIQVSAIDTPFLVVSSAQAVPVLQPYVQSGQITGLLGGLSGAASYQQLTQDTSGSLSAYWDAYQVGMLLTAIFMILGAVVFGSIKLIGKFKKA